MNGYKVVKDLSTHNRWTGTTRYKSLKLEKNGKYYLYKEPSGGTNPLLLQNEVRWREFFDTVNFPEVTYSQIVEVADNHIVFEWVDAQHLAEPDQKSLNQMSNDISKYARLLVAMDEAADGYRPQTDDSKARDQSRFQISEKYLKTKYPMLIKDKWITQDDIDFAKDCEKNNEKHLEQRYQHGDFVPWHIFNKEGQWIIYDAEHANTQKYRFRDLIHSYSRIFAKGQSPDLAKKLMSEFIKASTITPEEFDQKTKLMFVMRSFGNLMDASNDISENNYLKEARELLDTVKGGVLNSLTS